MNLQWAVAGVVVAASAAYALWTLMPATLRRALAAASLRLPLPRAVAARMRVHAEAASSCGCSGCDRNPMAATPGSPAEGEARPITVHRRHPG